MTRLPIVPPDAGAFATSLRNLDLLPPESRHAWASAITERRNASPRPLPERAIVELANTCNLDCPMCRVGEFGVDLSRVMPLARFDALVASLLRHVKDVRLNGLGETTLVPDLHAYLDRLDPLSCHLELISNGTGPCDVYERLFARGATVLISWDAATPETFEKVRRPARWDEMRARLQRIGEASTGRRGRLLLLFTLQASTAKELPSVVDLAAHVGARGVLVNVAKLADDAWLTRCAPVALASFHDAEERAAELGVELHLPDHLGGIAVTGPSVARTPHRRCERPWREVVVRWDGAVQVCNMFNPYVYGHLDVTTFERAWNGVFASAFRDLAHGEHAHPYCRDCYYMEDVYERTCR